jgi:two-component system, cell cycle sensor histidine kinase and response regulator CckA
VNEPLRVSLDHLLEGVQIIDADWRYVYVNAAAAAQGQRAASELLGRTMMECYPGIEETDLFTTLTRVKTTGTPHSMRNEFAYPSGERRWFDLFIERVPAGLCVLSLDVTAKRRAEEELRHAQRMEALGRLAGGIAHDFNNQLTAILGLAEILLDEHTDDALRRDLTTIKDAAERSAALTRQLLTFSRRAPIHIKPTDLNDVVGRVDRLLERLLGAHVRRELRLDPDLPLVRADAQQLENVLTNLAVNARDAMPHGGHLMLQTASAVLTDDDIVQHPSMKTGCYAVLSVADTGHGMDEATRAHIFDPFFTTKGEEGAGLGLAMVYGMVTQMDGFIWVYSEPGHGATFRLYFPTATHADAREEYPAEGQREARRAATVLVIEDEAGVRAMIARTLKRHGHRVLEAASGDEARRCLEELDGPVDVVLSDVILPGEQAADLLATLPLGSAKIVLMSGYTDAQIPGGRAARLPHRMLAKPFTARDVLRAIDEALVA